MTRNSVETIVRALNESSVRYLIVGGLAVVAHGHVRFTADIDLVLAPDRDNLEKAVEVLSRLGYTPRAPVPFRDFAAPERRSEWARDKGMTVFSTFSPHHPATEVDLFLEPPFDFEQCYRDRVSLDVSPGTAATFISRSDLIRMKRSTGRPLDLDDANSLEATDSEEGTSS